MGQYVQLLIQEMECSQRLNRRPLQSIFFGGGAQLALDALALFLFLIFLCRSRGTAGTRPACRHSSPHLPADLVLTARLPILQARPRSLRCRC